jgi:hydroxypyruvate isomerase
MRSPSNTGSRRSFLGTIAATAAAALLPVRSLYAAVRPPAPAVTPFSMRYAPPIGMFEGNAGKDPLDQIRFMADQGFRALFDNGLMNRPVAEQEATAWRSARSSRTPTLR